MEVPAPQVAGLRALAASCGATTFMALLAIWQVSVQAKSKAQGRTDVCSASMRMLCDSSSLGRIFVCMQR